jgi:hypothetical protein
MTRVVPPGVISEGTSTLLFVRTDIQRGSRYVARYHPPGLASNLMVFYYCSNIAPTFPFQLDIDLISGIYDTRNPEQLVHKVVFAIVYFLMDDLLQGPAR